MYSAVLMLALTAGSETADFGRNRCHGCTTGYSTGVATCSSYAGCASSSHEHHGLFGNRSHGCSSSYGCSSSHGCQGGGLFSRHRSHGCSSSYGCTSSYGCAGTYGCTGGAVIVPGVKKDMIKEGEPLKNPKKAGEVAAPATIVVSLPADARLIVDGAPTKSATERRTLVTPNLEVGSTYIYSMRAEVVRDGRTLTQIQNVTVRGGETSTVQFQFSSQAVASR